MNPEETRSLIVTRSNCRLLLSSRSSSSGASEGVVPLEERVRERISRFGGRSWGSALLESWTIDACNERMQLIFFFQSRVEWMPRLQVSCCSQRVKAREQEVRFPPSLSPSDIVTAAAAAASLALVCTRRRLSVRGWMLEMTCCLTFLRRLMLH